MNSKISSYESFNEFTKRGAELGIGLRTIENDTFDGRIIILDGKPKKFFGNCSYLGLETDTRVKAAAIDAITRQGICLSCSRHYLSTNDSKILSDLLENIFGQPCLLMPMTNLASAAIITTRISSKDAIFLDQQVHTSVNISVNAARVKGTFTSIIPHNRMDILEERIQSIYDKYESIWYMADGVYSMFGDKVHMKDLYDLMDKYPKLKVFVDDAHGLSWAGEKGIGSALNQVSYFHSRLYFVASLAKGFGGQGGVAVFPNEKERDIVKNTSPQHIFLSPLNNAVIGANIACAKIHLSNEMTGIQNELKELISVFASTCKLLEIPLVNPDNDSPIFYIGTGTSELAILFSQRLLQSGFYVNIASSPVVPRKHAGMRIVLTRHLNEEDIKSLLYLIHELLNELLPVYNIEPESISKAFEPYFV
ncbi:MAG: aminotransferase class I/II-fold pyridoxal phosphate-dependent enzyme [Saprospiraceae bacterium]